MFDVIKEIPEGEELVVFLLPETNPEDTLSLSALALLRTSLYRRTLDSIMSEAPLDLSRSLVSSKNEDDDVAKESSTTFRVREMDDKTSSSSDDLEPVPLNQSFKRTGLESNCANPFLTNPFSSSGSVLPNYFPFGFPPHPLLHPSPFPLSRISPIVSESFLSMGKSSPSSSAPPKNAAPISPSPSKDLLPLRLQPPVPKRRERTMLPCSECGKAFDRPSLLKRHMRTHTGEKPHVCDVCGKGFSTSSSLNTHRRIHSGEKPHQCGVCGKRFTASSNLYYHKMTHVKEKPHKCTLCTRSFPTPGDLRSHMFVHNGQWPHKCAVCGKGFSKLTNLRNHTLLHSGDRQPKRNFSLEHLERSSESVQDLPPSSSSLFPSLQPSSLSPPLTVSPPLHLLSSSSSLLPLSFPLSLSVTPSSLSERGRGEEKCREEKMEEELRAEVVRKTSMEEVVETLKNRMGKTSATKISETSPTTVIVDDEEPINEMKTSPETFVETSKDVEKVDKTPTEKMVETSIVDESSASSSFCSTSSPTTSSTKTEHLPNSSNNLPQSHSTVSLSILESNRVDKISTIDRVSTLSSIMEGNSNVS